MARYLGPVCKLCRREGEKLVLKGERCLTPKCAMERRSYPPGLHGRRRRFRQRSSDYSLQLREKQKVRRIYGVLERQFRRYFAEADRQRGLTGDNLLRILESRLDNIVYRLGFAESRAQARQLVCHGHFDLNGRRANIPSMLVKPGDRVAVREVSRDKTYFRGIRGVLSERTVADWLRLEPQNLAGELVASPPVEEMEIPLNRQLVVEYYSR